MTEIENMWEELKFEVGTIGSLLLAPEQKEVLIGSGDKDSDVLFIGDDPDLYENENFKVSPGSNGEFLLKLCDLEDITPDKYYITTVTKRNAKLRFFDSEDIDKLNDILSMQIALMKPKLIVCLGAEVAKVLLGKDIDLEKERGHLIKWTGGIDVLITYDVNSVKNSRLELGKKSKIAINFWNDLKIIKGILVDED